MAETPSSHTTGSLSEADRKASLGQLATLFLRLGVTAFGGPAAHIAMMEDAVVNRRRWLGRQRFLALLGVLLAFLRADLVARLHWLAGGKGAVLATVAIFLPAFFLVAFTGPLLPRLRKSKTVSALLDGVNAASLGLMLAVELLLARAAIFDLATALTAIGSATLLLRFKVNPTWLILTGAAFGIIYSVPHVR